MNTSFMIVKPDGYDLYSRLLEEMSTCKINIKSSIKIKDFDKLAIPLYLDESAIARGNAPIIFGINKVWEEEYHSTEATLLVVSANNKVSHDEFVKKVCSFKKWFRAKYIKNAYKAIAINADKLAYSKDDLDSDANLRKRLKYAPNGNPIYNLQLNALHSPDDLKSFYRESEIIAKFLGDNTIFE